MRRLIDLPIRTKLLLITLAASGVALLVAGVVIVVYDGHLYREQKVRETAVQAEFIAASVAPSLLFDDAAAAEEYLGALVTNPEIDAAAVYAPNGTLFASYHAGATPHRAWPARLDAARALASGPDTLTVRRPIRTGAGDPGEVLLRVRLEAVTSRILRYGTIIMLVMGGSLLTTILISRWLHTVIVDPISEITALVRAVASGSLTVRVKRSERADEIGVLEENFAQMLDSLRRIISQLSDEARLLSGSADGIRDAAGRMAVRSAQAVDAVSATSTTVAEVKQTAAFSSRTAEQVAESAQRTAQVSLTGKRAVEESTEAMQRVQVRMESIARSLLHLSERSEAIGTIIGSVGDLAEQSNLLAVNAAIEAAKAGEEGKGFAVVAQEIRRLADQSKQSTRQVRGILIDIQKAMTAAVAAAEDGSTAVEVGVAQTADAGDAIAELARSAQDSAQAATQIAASARQQLAGMDELAHAMRSILDASTHNAAGTRELEISADDLKNLSGRMREVVERYRL